MQRLDAFSCQLIDAVAAGSQGPVCVAVSGGSDSLSLLNLSQAWAEKSGRDLLVLTIDHGLRPEAAEEARWVADLARDRGVAAEILTWSPEKRSQNAARKARHALLAEAARAAGSGTVLIGHTLTDVVETLLMRLSRPVRLAGAVGPQPVSVSPVWPEGRGIILARPLLSSRRADLVADLEAKGQSWISDPGNEADYYERVRVRRLVAALDGARLKRICFDAMRIRAVEDLQLSQLLIETVHTDPGGLIEVDIGRVDAAPGVRGRFLDVLLQAASGTSHGAAAQSVTDLAEMTFSGGPRSRVTLGGAWVQRRGNQLLVGRDPGEARKAWADGIWDGRYQRLRMSETLEPVERMALPFLVRQSAPGEPAEEIISARLAQWSRALRLGAQFSAAMVQNV
ncbi:MAG TPA: tRNA lysidine(34) synthetase TilS [Henriciella marina]|uniref:tRNA lysidine(34) synthetase TilS n=1 Tax=Henriciella sp. TaxID=1968823 RepID=UPI0018390153|nr:tRNA lysidine(34) synthetase TilS [Henriciella sp.]HIG22420.1 tRNA lysidine(34) synthetase TilS [Henriciella sp.]HIK64732.1 tRNA lysidine(34) synthetase TilS [Henriciella marina]